MSLPLPLHCFATLSAGRSLNLGQAFLCKYGTVENFAPFAARALPSREAVGWFWVPLAQPACSQLEKA